MESNTKFTIVIEYSLAQLKRAYKKYYGETKSPSKKEVSEWLATLAQSDVQDFLD